MSTSGWLVIVALVVGGVFGWKVKDCKCPEAPIDHEHDSLQHVIAEQDVQFRLLQQYADSLQRQQAHSEGSRPTVQQRVDYAFRTSPHSLDSLLDDLGTDPE